MESSVTKLKNSRVNVMTPYELKGLHGTEGQIEKVILGHLEDETDEKEIQIDRLVVNHGFQINLEPITTWGLEMKDGMIAVDSGMQTSVEGVFAIGDIAYYPDKLGLIAGAFNEGPIAVNHAKKSLIQEIL